MKATNSQIFGEAKAAIDMLARVNGAHILLAEDNEFSREVIVQFLEKMGVVVYQARNGREALEFLRHSQFDCVLMDVQMPVMNGFEATRLIRLDNAYDYMPIIAITGNASDESRQCCFASGMDAFMPKPFKPEVFFDEIARWLPDRQISAMNLKTVLGHR